MSSYCELGLIDYIIYRDFYNEYKLNHQNAWSLLTGGSNSDGKSIYASFKAGTFKITNLDFAEDCAEKITRLKKYYEGYKRQRFVMAMIRCFRNPEFNFDIFERKLQYLSARLINCTTVNEYLSIIEKIYNYNMKKDNRIRLF